MPPMTDRDWVIRHLSPLMDEGKKILSVSDKDPTKAVPTYDKGYWTGLKLILLKYYLKPYLNILGKQGKKLAYVDLFAGPGLDKIGDSETAVLGSPLIPLVIRESRYQFASLIFSEIDPDYCTALKKRVALVDSSGRPTVLCEDANIVVKHLSDILRGIDHALVFLDPEGMELDWNSLNQLVSNIDCDLIINFPSSGIVRNLQNRQTDSRMDSFLGLAGEKIPTTANEDWALAKYRSNLQKIGKDISMEIKVKSGGGFHYHLIPAVRKTMGASPWFREIFGPAKQRIEAMTGQVLGYIAEQIDGKQESLDSA